MPERESLSSAAFSLDLSEKNLTYQRLLSRFVSVKELWGLGFRFFLELNEKECYSS